MRPVSWIPVGIAAIALFAAVAISGTGIGVSNPITSTGGANPTIGLDILTSGTDGDDTTTTGDSGLQIVGGDLTLYRGCGDGEILKWTESTDAWDCANDSGGGGGGGAIIVQLGDSTVVASSTVIDFATGDFTVSETPSGEANIGLGANVLLETELDSEAELETQLADVADVFTDNDGALDDDDLTNDTLTTLSDVDLTGDAATSILIRNAGDTAYNDQIMSGDATMGATGVIEVTQADALESDPSACSSNQFVTDVDTTVTLTCAQPDHGNIAGLSDDDHAQYALLAGRSGGQTLIGGTGAGDDLTFQTTSNGSKGSYIFSELDCTGNANGGALTATSTGEIICTDDDGGSGGSGDITDVFNCSSGNCDSITVTDGDLLDFSNVNANAPGEGFIFPQNTDCSGSTGEGQVCWDTDDNRLVVGNSSTSQTFFSGDHTSNTNAGTICTGTTTYLDGEGSCDDLSSVYNGKHIVATFTVCASDAVDTTFCDYTADGTNDEEQIVAALAACPALGCLVYLTEGTFTIEEPTPARGVMVTIDDNQHLRGAGVDATSLVFATGRGVGLDRYIIGTASGTDYGAENWSVSDMTLIAADASDHGVQIRGAQNGLLADLRIVHNGGEVSVDEGIQFSGSGTNAVRQIVLQNILIEDFGQNLIEFASDVHDLDIVNLTVRNGGSHGVNFRNGESAEATDPRRINFYGLSAYENSGNGVFLDRALDINFYGSNIHTNTNAGISSNGATNVKRISVFGGTIWNNDNNGITSEGEDWLVQGVRIFNNAQDGGASAGNRVGIRDVGDNNTFINNHIFDDQGSPTQLYSIQIAGSATSTLIAFNKLETGATGTINDLGGSTKIVENEEFQRDIRIYEDEANGGNYVGVSAASSMSSNQTCTLEDDATPFDPCISADSVSVNGSAVDTTANFLDGDIDFTLVDGGAGGPDDITATVDCADCVTLATETTGAYLETASGGDGILVTGVGAEQATAAVAIDLVDDADGTSATTTSESGLEFLAGELSMLRGCSNGEIQKWVSSTESWDCSADSTGGTPTFDSIATGTNTTATMTVGSGAEIILSGSGHIEAAQVLNAVNNDSGVTLFECTAVFISGFDIPSNLAEILIADADNAAAMPAIGIVHGDIGNGADGFVILSGTIESLDTTTGEGWSVGDSLFVNDSGTSADDDCGNTLTNVRPTNTDDLIQAVAIVERVHASNGELKIIGAGRINALPVLPDDQVWVGNSSNVPTAISLPDSDGATQKLQYDQATNSFVAGTDDDIPEAADYSNLTGGVGVDHAVTGTLTVDISEIALADDSIWQGSSGGLAVVEAIPGCDTNNRDRLQYATSTNTWICDTDLIDISDDTNLAAGARLEASGDTLLASVELYTDTKGLWFEDPTAADDFESIWVTRTNAVTLTKLWCESDQTVTLMLRIDDGTPADVDSVDLICTSTPDTDDALDGDTSMAVGDRLDLDLVSVSGTPTWVSIMWEFEYND